MSKIELIEREAELETKTAALAAALQKRLAKKGSLGLPPLLEQRRLEHWIPNGAFETQAVYDRVFVFQIAFSRQETFGDTRIIMPDSAKKRAREETPRGVLVSAGASALDHLRSHGIELGHVVKFIRLSPWRMEVEYINGQAFYVLVMRDGDIVGSEDLRASIREKRVSVEWDETANKGDGAHVIVDLKTKKRRTPRDPWIPEDM